MSFTVGLRHHFKKSVYKRVADLIKSGVLEHEQRPLWFDVYKAHPPVREPVYVYEAPPNKFGLPDTVDDVRNILYPEDWARSVGYSKFTFSGIAELDPNLQVTGKRKFNHVQKFVALYQKLEKEHPGLTKTELYMKTEEEIQPVLEKLYFEHNQKMEFLINHKKEEERKLGLEVQEESKENMESLIQLLKANKPSSEKTSTGESLTSFLDEVIEKPSDEVVDNISEESSINTSDEVVDNISEESSKKTSD